MEGGLVGKLREHLKKKEKRKKEAIDLRARIEQKKGGAGYWKRASALPMGDDGGWMWPGIRCKTL
jgi:hypothetical protein